MSVSAAGSGGAYAYLRSILKQQSASAGTNPTQSLLDAFYPNGAAGTGASGTTAAAATSTASGSSGGLAFSPDMYGAMLSLQGAGSGTDPTTARAQSIFSQFDSDSDGAVTKSEFESAFGTNADTTKVDGLFSALDTDGNGSVSASELTSAAQQSHARHRHHHRQDGDGSGGDPLAQLMAATQGASSTSTTGQDGSTSTTITFADGSTVTMNVPATSSTGQSVSGADATSNSSRNLLEQLIRLQSQLISQTAGTTTGSTTAVNLLT